jgi:hypothetical protein
VAKNRQKVKALHALNWLYGNICTRKCGGDDDKQKGCYEKMRQIISGHEEFMITHKLFVKTMREKHRVCGLSDEIFYKRESGFWRHRK